MKLGSLGWLSEIGDLGQAFVEVLKAELAALKADLSQSGQTLLRGVAVVALAILILGWVAGLLSLTLIFFLSLYMPTWAAALSVSGALALVAVALLFWGRSLFREVRRPADLVQSRVDGHVEWMQGQIRKARSTGGESDDETPEAG